MRGVQSAHHIYTTMKRFAPDRHTGADLITYIYIYVYTRTLAAFCLGRFSTSTREKRECVKRTASVCVVAARRTRDTSHMSSRVGVF